MAEIRVPVSAPGAQQAANELRGVSAAAAGVGKAEEQAAKSSTSLGRAFKQEEQNAKQFTRALKEQTAELARQTRENEKASRAPRVGGVFSALGRGGGVGGGALGRVGGGLGSTQLGGLGVLAGAAAVAGFGLLKLNEASAAAVDRAMALAKAQVEYANTIRDAQKAIGENALGSFKANEKGARSALAAGVSSSDITSLAGQGFDDAPGALSTVADFKDKGRGRIALNVAKILKNLGETGSLGEGLGKLPEDRIANAGTGETAVLKLLQEIVGENHGGAPISTDRIVSMMQRVQPAGWNPGAKALQGNANASGLLTDTRFNLAFDPAAATAARGQMAALKDPVAAAILENTTKQTELLDEMGKGAKAQNKLVALLQDIFSPTGSIQTQLDRANTDRGKVALGAVY